MNNDFAIFRLQKLKTTNEIRRCLLHIFREQPTPNADPNQYHLNESLISKVVTKGDHAMQRLKSRLARMDKPPRKNAVLAVEALFTASPEYMLELSVEQRRCYFKDCVRWISGMVGAENIAVAQIHRCETTEHLHLIFLPIPKSENSLNYRKIFGGNKHRLSEIQDMFHSEVALRYGLKRGVKGSRATHQSLSEYNTLVNQSLPRLRAEKKQLEIECNDLKKKLVRARELLDSIAVDIKKAMEEHKEAVKYCLSALKERLLQRWGMVHDGKNQFTHESNRLIEELNDQPKPTLNISRPRR